MSSTHKYFDIITIFPEFFTALEHGIVGRAIATNKVTVRIWNPRDFNDSNNRQIDDRPFGGEAGMVMRAEPLKRTLDHIKSTHQLAQPPLVAAFTANVKPLCHQDLQNLPEHLILVCGRYQGIDQRFLENEVDCLWSIGDYTLSGGEIPALAVIDTLTRQQPGVLGNHESLISEAENQQLISPPLYTRPANWRGHQVPAPLLTGNHATIKKWRQEQSQKLTSKLRPEWLKKGLQDDKKSV